MPGATLLNLTSSSTLDRSCYLRSQISSGYIAIRLERHQGHSARSHAAHPDEFVYSGQVTLPEESDQLRLHCHSAGKLQLFTLTSSSHQSTWTSSAQLLSLTSSSHQSTWTSSYSTVHLDELFPSVNMDELQLFTLTSSSHQSTWTSSAQLLSLTSSSHQSTWTSSYSTVHLDELFPSVNMDELQLFSLTSSSHHSTWTSSYPAIQLDELFPSVNMDELCSTPLFDELFPSANMDDL